MIQLDIHVYLFFLPLTIFLTLGKILWVNSPIKCDWTIRMNGGSLGKRGFKKNKVCFLKFIFNWQIIALQYCVGFWYQQCEPAISIFMSLPLEPPPPRTPSHLSRLSLSTRLSCLCYTALPDSYLFYIWQCLCFIATLSVGPTLFFPSCVQSLFSVSIRALQIGSSVPFFWIPYIYINIQNLFFSFWLQSV